MHYVNDCYINILIMYVLNNVSLQASKQLPPDCTPDIPAPAPVLVVSNFRTWTECFFYELSRLMTWIHEASLELTVTVFSCLFINW